jgi:hypothetical protein
MTALRLVHRRARAHVGLLLLVLAQVALTTAAVAGATGYVSLAERDGVADTLAAVGPRAATLQVAARLSDDPAGQDAAARAVVAEHLGHLPVDVHASLASSALATARGAPEPAATAAADPTDDDAPSPDTLPSAVLWADADLPDAATLTAGAWPAGPGEAALQADAAARLDLAVGDVVSVTARDTTVPLTITGTWLPTDPDDPRWFGDPLAAEGSADDGAVAGPYVVLPEVVAGLDGLRYQRWTLAPDPARLLPRDLGALAAGLAAAVEGLDDDPAVDVAGLTTEGGLEGTLADLEARIAGVRGVTTAAVLLVVLTGLIALSQMARLLAEVRLPETVLLRSRGTSVAQITTASVAEAAVVGVAGAALGAGAAAAALVGTGVGRPPLVGLATAAAVAAVLATGVLAQRAGSHAVGVVRRGRSDAAGRTVRAARAGAVVVALAAAALAWWELDRYGSPVFRGLDGRVHVDPLAGAAVALGLLTVALGAVVLLAPWAGLAAGAAQRRRDLMPVLALRELARHTPVHAVTVVLVVLAAGAGTFVGAYAGTLEGWRADVRRAAVGADVRLDLAATPAGAVPAAAVARDVPGAAAVVPARVLSLGAGDASGDLVAVPTAAAADLRLPGGAAALARESAAPSLPLPDGATVLDLAAALTTGLPDPPGMTAAVWLTDATGELLRLDAGPGDATPGGTLPGGGVAPASYAWRVDLPDGAWSVAAVDLTWDAVPDTPEYTAALERLWGQTDPAVIVDDELPPQPDVTAELTGLRATGAGGAGAASDLLAGVERWEAATFTDQPAPAAGAAVTLDRSVAAFHSGTPVRLLPGGDQGPLPVLVTAAWRAGYDVEIGGTTVMRVANASTDVVVAAEAAVVPGSAPAARTVVPGAADGADDGVVAALADLALVNRHLLRTRPDLPAPDTVWLVADAATDLRALAAAAQQAADRAADDAPRVARVTTAEPPADRLSEPAVVAAWLAAGCALVVMVPGVASTAVALSLGRRREAAVLRALGVGPGQQARARRGELALVAGTAVVVGVAGGLAVAALTAGPLVRATVPGPASLPTVLAPDAVGAAGAVAATVMLLALVVVGYGAQVARQVRAATRVAEDAA